MSASSAVRSYSSSGQSGSTRSGHQTMSSDSKRSFIEKFKNKGLCKTTFNNKAIYDLQQKTVVKPFIPINSGLIEHIKSFSEFKQNNSSSRNSIPCSNNQVISNSDNKNQLLHQTNPQVKPFDLNEYKKRPSAPIVHGNNIHNKFGLDEISFKVNLRDYNTIDNPITTYTKKTSPNSNLNIINMNINTNEKNKNDNETIFKMLNYKTNLNKYNSVFSNNKKKRKYDKGKPSKLIFTAMKEKFPNDKVEFKRSLYDFQNNQTKDILTKVRFWKGVMDYSFPKIISMLYQSKYQKHNKSATHTSNINYNNMFNHTMKKKINNTSINSNTSINHQHCKKLLSNTDIIFVTPDNENKRKLKSNISEMLNKNQVYKLSTTKTKHFKGLSGLNLRVKKMKLENMSKNS